MRFTHEVHEISPRFSVSSLFNAFMLLNRRMLLRPACRKTASDQSTIHITNLMFVLLRMNKHQVQEALWCVQCRKCACAVCVHMCISNRFSHAIGHSGECSPSETHYNDVIHRLRKQMHSSINIYGSMEFRVRVLAQSDKLKYLVVVDSVTIWTPRYRCILSLWYIDRPVPDLVVLLHKDCTAFI